MNPLSTITQFVLERIHDEPIHKQIPLYRALAEVTVDTEAARALQAEAKELEEAENRQRHIRLTVIARGAYNTSRRQ